MIDADRRTLQRIKRLEDRLALVRRRPVGTSGSFQPLDAELTALAALNSAADQLPYFNGVNSAALTQLTASGRSLIGLDGTADRFPFFPADGVAATTTITPFARSLLADANAKQVRGAIGVAADTAYWPEDFGAVGNNPGHNDAPAFQACIDAIYAAGEAATIRLDPTKTYYWNSAPRTDRGGNCIVSLNDRSAGQTPISFIGADHAIPPGSMATIRTNRTTDNYSATYGAPSMLGGLTPENPSPGWGGAGLGSVEYCGPLSIHGVRFTMPANPSIAAIDARSVGGIDLSYFNIQADASTTALCTNAHAVGLFTPRSFAFGVMEIGQGAIAGMYVGVVPGKADHIHWGGLWIYNCVAGIAFEDDAAGALGSHANAPGYVGVAQCVYGMCAWKIVAGVPQIGPLTSGHRVYVNPMTMEMEAGTGDFSLIDAVLDGNDQLYGDLHISSWPGMGDIPVTGAANLRITTPRGAHSVTTTGWQDWTPTSAGWASDPTGPTASVYRYQQVDKTVTLLVRQPFGGTSNATTKSLSLPVNAGTAGEWQATCRAMDGGTALAAPAFAVIATGGTTVTFDKTGAAAGGWTASGNCRITSCQIIYELD